MAVVMESTLVAGKRALTVGLCAGVLAIAFEGMSVSTAMPEAARELGRLDLYAWVFSLFTIGMLSATVIGGRVGDQRGPLVPLGVGFSLFTAGLVVAGTAPTMELLLAGRLLQGVGSGALNVGYALLLAHAYDAAERPRMLSWYSTMWVVPSLAGPPVAAFITHALSWHWVFFSIIPLVVLAVVMGATALARLPREALRGEDHLGDSVPVAWWTAPAVGLGAAGVQWAGQALGDPAIGLSPASAGVAVVGVVLLGVAVPRLMPARRPEQPGGRLPLLVPIVTRALIAGAFFGASAFYPLLMVQVYGWSLLAAGATLTVGAVGWTAGSWLQSHRSLPWRRDQVLVAGTVLVAAGLGVVALVPWTGLTWLAFLGWLVAGLGMGMCYASTTLVLMLRSEASQQGRNNAALQVGESLGNSLLVGMAGAVYVWLSARSLVAAFGTLLLVMACLAVLAVVTATRVGLVRDHEPDR